MIRFKQIDEPPQAAKPKGEAKKGAAGAPETSTVSDSPADARVTVSKESGGGNKSGSGSGVKDTKVSSKRGGKLGGKAAAARPAATRKRNAAKKKSA